MKQSFIVLGHGLTDLYEFKTLIEYNHQRIERLVFFPHPKVSRKTLVSGLNHETH